MAEGAIECLRAKKYSQPGATHSGEAGLPRSTAIFVLRSASVVGVRLLGRLDVLGLVIFAFGRIGLIDRAARFRAIVSGRARIGGIRLRSVHFFRLVRTHMNFPFPIAAQ